MALVLGLIMEREALHRGCIRPAQCNIVSRVAFQAVKHERFREFVGGVVMDGDGPLLIDDVRNTHRVTPLQKRCFTMMPVTGFKSRENVIGRERSRERLAQRAARK